MNPEDLAALVGDLSDEKRELLELLLKDQGVELSDSMILPQKRVASPDGSGFRMPLSFAQERLWFLDQLEPQSILYNLPTAVRLEGELDIQALLHAIEEIIRRHEILRTVFGSEDGEPYQLIKPELKLEIPFIDLQPRAEAANPAQRRSVLEAEIQRLAIEDANTAFNLACGPLLRVKILRLAETEHAILLNVHHIIADGWSVDVLLFELSILYQAFSTRSIATGTFTAQNSPLPKMTLQYADYAVWQRKWLQGKVIEKQLAYWIEKLSGCSGVLDLPVRRKRGQAGEAQSSAGRSFRFSLDSNLAKRLHEFAQANGVTMFMMLLAAFQALLYRYSGQEDLCIGVPVTNRTRAEIEGLIGFIVNTVVLRADFSGDPTFDQFLKQVRETTLEAFANQELPFEVLVEKLEIERNMERSPLFQALFSMQNVPIQASQLPGITMSSIPVDSGIAKFELSLIMLEDAGQLSGVLEYTTALFDLEMIERMAIHFKILLEGIVSNPHRSLARLPLLSEAEHKQLLFDWNQTFSPVEGQRIDRLFERQVQVNPDQIALVYVDEAGLNQPDTAGGQAITLTYAVLDRRAEALAGYLRQVYPEIGGVGIDRSEPAAPVGILLNRSVEMIVAILGVLKAGGAYLPLDPGYPAERINFMVNDAQIKVLLTGSQIARIADLGAWPTVSQVVYLDNDWEKIENHEFTVANLASVANARDREQARPDNQDGERLAYVIYTSGSTGQPKGALLRQRGLCNLVHWQRDTFGIDQRSRILQFSSFSFDASVWEIFMALANGATLCLAAQDILANGLDLVRLLKQQAITVVTLPPSVLAAMPVELISQAALPDLQTVIAAGEACPGEVVARWAPGRKFYNAYGPTETTVCASATLCDPADPDDPPIGQPIANTQLYIVDRQMELAPVGIPGELLVGGVGVARGYLRRAELTTEKFIPNPFGSGQLYRTGDLACYRPDGAIDFLGRIDQQVKLRGFRIELGEIESVLRRYLGVERTSEKSIRSAWLEPENARIQDAAVVLLEEQNIVQTSHRRLAAFIVPTPPLISSLGSPDPAAIPDSTPGETLRPEDLRKYLRKYLPEYMIPASFIFVPELPLTPSGKVDRKALSRMAADWADPSSRIRSEKGVRSEITPPRTPVEQLILSLYQQLLPSDGRHPLAVGIDDNFFELGGHSLLATQLISRLRKTFQVEIPVRSLFDNPTVAGLAVQVEQLLKGGAGLPRPPVIPLDRNQKPGMLTEKSIRAEIELPLSFAQQRLWFLEQFEPGTATYNIPCVLWFDGAFNIEAFRASVNAIVQRHEILRSAIVTQEGKPVQVVLPELKVELPLEDLSKLVQPAEPLDTLEELAVQLAAREIKRPFDLNEAPLFRLRILRVGEQKHLVVLTMHHIISDGWSIGVILAEISAFYRLFLARADRSSPDSDLPALLPELPIQYADYAAWQRSWLLGDALDRQLAYWRTQLNPLPLPLDLPVDRPRPALRSHAGDQLAFRIDENTTTLLNRLSREAGVTLFMTLLSAFQVLLTRVSGQTDICVGTPIANRNSTEIENLIGFFVNTLVIRTNLSGAPAFREILNQVRRKTLDAYTHQDIPFEMLVSELQPERDTSHSPLFQVMFVMQNVPLEAARLAGITVRSIDVSTGVAKFDLTLTVTETDHGLSGVFEYDQDLFNESTIQNLADDYRKTLEEVIKDPGGSIVSDESIRSGKIDEANSLLPAALAAARLYPNYEAPRSPVEAQLAEIWEQVLGIKPVGVFDNFFELGGDSILSIQVTAQASLVGVQITPRQIFEAPTIAELALLAGTGEAILAEQGSIHGAVPLTPIEYWFVERNLLHPDHFNQSLLVEVKRPLESEKSIQPEILSQSLAYLIQHHDALRLRLSRRAVSSSQVTGQGAEQLGKEHPWWEQYTADWDGDIPFDVIRLIPDPPENQDPPGRPLTSEKSIPLDAHIIDIITRTAGQIQASLSLENGPLIRMVYFDLGPAYAHRLLIVIHHLAVDGVSWRILMEDLQNIYAQVESQIPVRLPPKTTSFQAWARRLEEYAATPAPLEELDFWLKMTENDPESAQSLPDELDEPFERSIVLEVDFPGGSNTEAATRVVHRELELDETRWLVQDVPAIYKTETQDILLTALIQAAAESVQQPETEPAHAAPAGAGAGQVSLLIALETHGREDIFPDINLSRTVGWFTNIYPLKLTIPSGPEAAPGLVLKTVKQQLRSIPRHGLGYGILRYLRPDTREMLSDLGRKRRAAQISFNYLGQLEPLRMKPSALAPQIPAAEMRVAAAEQSIYSEIGGAPHDLAGERAFLIEVNCAIVGGRFSIDWAYSGQLFASNTIERIAERYMIALRRLIHHGLSSAGVEYSPSDFPLAGIDQTDLDKVLRSLRTGSGANADLNTKKITGKEVKNG
jgi:amino acid adenylation domain-containing protein/non-ribosomal peptide synthase protein (TIGR01720 family)